MLILVILAIVLMGLDRRYAGMPEIRAMLSMPLLPLQYAVSWPIQSVDKMRDLFSTHDRLMKENIRLKAEALLLKAQMQRFFSVEYENNQLKALLRSSTQVQGKVLIAQLLAVDSDPFINQVVLDKGSRDHIFVGQPVLDANGVMGQVIQVGLVSSRVLLINDVHSGVPVQNTRNGIRAIAVGDHYSRKLRLTNVAQTVDVKVGDVFVTSGLGRKYSEGYPVGVVQSVSKDPGLPFATILLEPSAKLDRSRQVLLLWPDRIAPSVSSVSSSPSALPVKKETSNPKSGK